MTSFKTPPPPQPAYIARPGSILFPDAELYTRIADTAHSTTSRELLTSFTIAPRSGRAWRVPAGGIFRLSTPAGPQVGDLNLWHGDDPRERFWAARTRQLQRSHVRLHDRLWSSLPFLRPLCTVVADSLGSAYGADANGGRCHDLLGTRCDPYVNKMLTGDVYDFHCHSNLVRAVLPYGLTEFDVHDVLNVFQVTGLNEEGKYFMSPSPADQDTYIEFFAEQPLLCALSTCPGGDLSQWRWAEGEASTSVGAILDEEPKPSMKDTCRPIKVEVWKISDSARDDVLGDWVPPQRADYPGMHGMHLPIGEDE